MKTDELIAILAADTLPQPPVARRLGRAMAGAGAVSIAAFALFWGLRADIGAALGSLAVLKTLMPLVVMALSLALALALAHPGRAHQRRALALGAVAAVAVLVFLASFARDGVTGLLGALSTPSLMTCLLSIPALALPLLGAGLWALSAGASLRPRWTGAAAGLAAGSIAAAIYSLYCDKDMVLFVLPAYSVAIGVVVLAGAAFGPRALRW